MFESLTPRGGRQPRRERRPLTAADLAGPRQDEDEPEERRWRITGLVPVLPGWRVVEACEDSVLLEQGRPEALAIEVNPLIAWALLEASDGDQQIRGVTGDRNVPKATVVGLDEDQYETVGVPADFFVAYLAPGEELTDELRDRAREHARAMEERADARQRRRAARDSAAGGATPAGQ